MSTPLTNDFNAVIEVAKSIADMVEATVSVHPRMYAKPAQEIEITGCHLCVFDVGLSCEKLEYLLRIGDFILLDSTERDGIQWDGGERESVRISIGKRI